MQASRIFYKNENRIQITFPYTMEATSLIKEIPDAQWSRTLKAWHIPYTKVAYNLLLKLFPTIELIKSKEQVEIKNNAKTGTSGKTNVEPIGTNKNISIQVFGRRITIKLPKSDSHSRFLLSFRYSRWDKKLFCWIIPNYPGNLELLQDFFKDRIKEIVRHEEIEYEVNHADKRVLDKDDLLIIKTKSGRLKLFFGFNKALTKTIKTLPYSNWNTHGKWWSVPFSDRYLKEIKETALSQSLRTIYEEEKFDGTKVQRKKIELNTEYRKCPPEYLSKLEELRYSKSTIKTYKNAFEEFINYYNKFALTEIDETMITAFLRYLVMERKISSSYQNQAINAVKFYYERILKGERKIYLVDRPRKEKTLPTVLNENEVTELIKAVENIKHKAIMMLAYSSGMRLGELLSLKIKDIDSTRMQIRIEQSKGKKDRYSILSVRLLEVLRKYFTEYKPKEWLFEGIKGGQYSSRSIQLIVQAAVKKARIKKKVSVHTLRHSFATHLLESGTDLRYIQSLLGHESSKTTEIYTHITTKGFDQIKSPLDSLDL